MFQCISRQSQSYRGMSADCVRKIRKSWSISLSAGKSGCLVSWKIVEQKTKSIWMPTLKEIPILFLQVSKTELLTSLSETYFGHCGTKKGELKIICWTDPTWISLSSMLRFLQIIHKIQCLVCNFKTALNTSLWRAAFLNKVSDFSWVTLLFSQLELLPFFAAHLLVWWAKFMQKKAIYQGVYREETRWAL